MGVQTQKSVALKVRDAQAHVRGGIAEVGDGVRQLAQKAYFDLDSSIKSVICRIDKDCHFIANAAVVI